MLKNIDFKAVVPYLAAIVIFLAITLVFFNPLLEGKVLKQGDIQHHIGMSKEIVDHRAANDGEEPLWTNSMFSGMPAYQISVSHKSNLLRYIDKYIFRLNIPRPADYLFLYMIGFFILMKSMKVDTWLSIVGAIAFAFSSYFIIILQAGHNSKAHAIGYMAPVLASIILTFRGKYLLGGVMMMLFLGLELNANHPQITYYLLLIVLILGIFELIDTFKKKNFAHFGKAIGILSIAVLIALSANFARYWTTMEYSKETIRGKSELSFDKSNKTSGLDRDYATQWSYGKAESFSFLIPNAAGGPTEALAGNEKAMDAISDPQMKNFIAQNRIASYFGNQPFTSGPVYMGAIVVFLFVLGLFLVKGKYKWVLLIATLLALFLSWGKNMLWFTDFFMDYMPAYNKFRAVSMTLVIAELSMVFLAFLALRDIIEKPGLLKKNRIYFYISLGLTAGLTLLFILTPDTFFSFLSNQEMSQMEKVSMENPEQALGYQQFFGEVQNGRIAIFTADAWRSFIFIILAAFVLFVYDMKKMHRNLAIGIIGVLILIDLSGVDRRYLNDDNYERSKAKANGYVPTQADLSIKRDTDISYRVFNLTVGNPFSDASTSYFHQSIGGYHGAKIRRYQDLIDHHISKMDINILNMLNTKYVIQPVQNAAPRISKNETALGNAWFVNDAYWVASPDQEIIHLGSVAELSKISQKEGLQIYGRELKAIDTLLINAELSLNNMFDDNPNAKLDLSRYQLQMGQEYIFGNNPLDTNLNFIDLSKIDKDNILDKQHFKVKVFYQFNPRRDAIINEKNKAYLADFKPNFDAQAKIDLESYKPNHLIYKTSCIQEQLAVFSEIYYAKGWNAYLDGTKVDYVRANYVLRAMRVPEGQHTIEFKFEPTSYKVGTMINLFGSGLIILLLIGSIAYTIKQKKDKENESLQS